MRIQLLSDLHLERQPDFAPRPAPGADVLVLAGDIGSYQRGSALSARGDEDFGLARFAHWPVPVLVVPGNHEYDALDFDATHARLRACCERLGLLWLEREARVLGGVRFIGTTLWTDFEALVPGGPRVSAVVSITGSGIAASATRLTVVAATAAPAMPALRKKSLREVMSCPQSCPECDRAAVGAAPRRDA